ncbi:sensor histidine kinase [Paenibacillus hexagrammi]|uniref:sensor histidine kinase n=1 Tax=Paenibacillus hexagrammi TaxID=2908839 RepID=UPI002882EAB6|nr:ATP-binding protein [Paenibacillus sp. YPD9-1]
MITKEMDVLRCEIIDNGDGMDLDGESEKIPNVTSKRQMFTGIGIRNVHDRLVLLYGEGYGVNISSSIGQGTKVTLTLPWATQSQDESAS